jgi:hypothetical protein
MAEVGRRAYPLSASVLALSILNGDYSLLIPEVYETGNKDSTLKGHYYETPMILTMSF